MHALKQVPFTEEQRRGRQIKSGPRTGNRKQRLDVRIARCSQANNFRIHKLLPRQARLSEQPPDGRMKPKQRSCEFLQKSDEPVVTPDMKKFMTGNAELSLLVQILERLWKQDRLAEEAERQRTRARCREKL